MRILTIVLAAAVTLQSFTAKAETRQAVKKDTVRVWGNCDMCKARIEKAASAAGASSATWDPDSQILSVSYNSSQSSLAKIEKSVAGAGYDTANEKASESAYNKLHKCCQYLRKEADAKDPNTKTD